MASLSYSVTYANIPFVLDQGKVVRIHQRYVENDPATLALPPRKHQPLADLIDEINRLYPLCYLQDFALPGDFQGRNIEALATLNKIGPFPNPQMKIWDYYYPTGASRWSVFRGLATSSMVKAMLAVTGGSAAATFVMEQSPLSLNNPDNNTSRYTITTQLYMLPPRPLAEHGGSFDGLYLITLVDERYYFQGTTQPLLTVTQNTQWSDLLFQLSSILGITINPPTIPIFYGQPEKDSQLWSREESSAALLDAVAANLGRVVVRNLDRTYDLLSPTDSQARVIANRGSANNVVRTAGGDFFTSGTRLRVGNLTTARNAVVPTQVNVTFPEYILGDDPVPHLVNERYQVQRPSAWYEDSRDVYTISIPISSGGGILLSGQVFASGMIVSGNAAASGRVVLSNPLSGLIGVSQETIHDTAKALFSGEISLPGAAPLNVSGLTALSMQIAADFYDQRVLTALDETYPGIFAWSPEGLHDIVWTYSSRTRQATTRVLKTQWNAEIREMQHATPALSGYTNTPRGVGGKSVAQTWTDGMFLSGQVFSSLSQTLLSGDLVAHFNSVANFPTQNRWVGQCDSELLLLEGTSSQRDVNIVYRAIHGTLPADHPGSPIYLVNPNTTYGVNYVAAEKMQFIFPHDWTSGGVQSVHVVPQTQTVLALDSVGTSINGTTHFSGTVRPYNPTFLGLDNQFVSGELIWIIERNNLGVMANTRYDGQIVGFSAEPAAPVYAVNLAPGSGGIIIISGVAPSSGFPSSGPIYPPQPVSGPINSGDPVPISGNTFKLLFSLGATSTTVGGFGTAADGRLLYVFNQGPGKLTLANNLGGAGSIRCPIDFDYVLQPLDEVQLEYQASLQRWVFATPTIGAGNPPEYGVQQLLGGPGVQIIPNGDGTATFQSPNQANGQGGDIHFWHHHGNWYGWFLGGIISGAEGGDPTIYFACPFLTTQALTASNIGIQAGNNDAVTHNIRLAIYSNTSPTVLYPKTLLFDSGNIAVAPSGGALAPQSAVCGTALLPNLYWLVVAMDDSNIDFQTVLIPAASTFIYGLLGATSLSNTLDGGWTVPVAGFGAFLADFPDIAGATPTQGSPFVMLQV